MGIHTYVLPPVSSSHCKKRKFVKQKTNTDTIHVQPLQLKRMSLARIRRQVYNAVCAFLLFNTNGDLINYLDESQMLRLKFCMTSVRQ